MTETTPRNHPLLRKPLRLWPGVATAVLLVLLRFILPLVMPDASIAGLLGAAACGLVIAAWWMFFSRAPWSERVGVLALLIVAGFATRFIVHPSIAGGMMGLMIPLTLALPGLALALVLWAVVSRGLAPAPRFAALVAIVVVACGTFALLRTDGVMGGAPQLAWRWTPTAEQRLLAQARDFTPPPASAPATAKTSDVAATPTASWPGFRGSGRDSIIRNTQIETDWAKSPPVEVWRRPIGPGWSSFAVQGDLLYTQEQRGDHEVVGAYRLSSGEPVWMHRDAIRFYESNGGAGPRATPAISNGRVYTLGATGLLNSLDAATGALVWSHNAATDAGVKVPGWGISGSPLVVGDLVVVAASGALGAYDRAGGERRWSLESEGGSYSSPHLATIDGTPQILLIGGAGVTAVAPADGKVLWKHAWAGAAIVQPAQAAGDAVLIATGGGTGGLGLRRLALARGPAGWSAEERWTSIGLKPYFNDFVVHEGHAFGFDGSILSCIGLDDGQRKWKGGRYGNGQLVLLADQDVMLVLSEEGELALVSATPDKFTELARFKAIEGKTWNHPVLVGDLLLVRNGEEMAAFRLPAARR